MQPCRGDNEERRILSGESLPNQGERDYLYEFNNSPANRNTIILYATVQGDLIFKLYVSCMVLVENNTFHDLQSLRKKMKNYAYVINGVDYLFFLDSQIALAINYIKNPQNF
jgi:hypothetical protein